MGKSEFYIEKPKENTNFCGMEFFLQRTKPNTVAAHAHIHDSIELLYARAGHFTVLLDGMEYAFSKGDLILFCSNSIHHISSGDADENSYYVIKVNPSLLLDLAGNVLGTSYLMRFSVSRSDRRSFWPANVLAGNPILGALEALITEYESGGYAKELAMKLCVGELLLAILRDDSEIGSNESDVYGDEMTGRIYASLIYMRQHFSEDLDARGVSVMLGVSYSYFSRSFGRITGKSFKEYLNLTRVNHAEQMLLTTSRSVTEIAAECGYNNVSYFISVYRRIKGMTPRKTAHGGLL